MKVADLLLILVAIFPSTGKKNVLPLQYLIIFMSVYLNLSNSNSWLLKSSVMFYASEFLNSRMLKYAVKQCHYYLCKLDEFICVTAALVTPKFQLSWWSELTLPSIPLPSLP